MHILVHTKFVQNFFVFLFPGFCSIFNWCVFEILDLPIWRNRIGFFIFSFQFFGKKIYRFWKLAVKVSTNLFFNQDIFGTYVLQFLWNIWTYFLTRNFKVAHFLFRLWSALTLSLEVNFRFLGKFWLNMSFCWFFALFW